MDLSNERPFETDDAPNRRSASENTRSVPRRKFKRTHRACDRCRLKKSKCNGQQPCNTCVTKERTCVFSALRRRDIRKWHCHMQDTTDEAIQRLYKACVECSNFPGIPPNTSGGVITTESILLAMGFGNLNLGPRSKDAQPPDLPRQSSLPSQSSRELSQHRRPRVTKNSTCHPTQAHGNASSMSSQSQSEMTRPQNKVGSRLESGTGSGTESGSLKLVRSTSSTSPLLDMTQQFDEAMYRQTKVKQPSPEGQAYGQWQWQPLGHEVDHLPRPIQLTNAYGFPFTSEVPGFHVLAPLPTGCADGIQSDLHRSFQYLPHAYYMHSHSQSSALPSGPTYDMGGDIDTPE